MEWAISIRGTGNPSEAKTALSDLLNSLSDAGHEINSASFSQQGSEDLAAPILEAKKIAIALAEAQIAIKG